VEIATQSMLELANDTGESASIAVPVGIEMQYAAQMDSAHHVQIRNWVGVRFPMHGGAPGLVVLASWSNDRIDEYLGRRLLLLTQANVADPVIDTIRLSGLLWTRDEGSGGTSTVSSAVRNSTGTVIGSIQVWGPSYRFPQTGTDLVVARQVVDVSKRVSSMLGFRRASPLPTTTNASDTSRLVALSTWRPRRERHYPAKGALDGHWTKDARVGSGDVGVVGQDEHLAGTNRPCLAIGLDNVARDTCHPFDQPHVRTSGRNEDNDVAHFGNSKPKHTLANGQNSGTRHDAGKHRLLRDDESFE